MENLHDLIAKEAEVTATTQNMNEASTGGGSSKIMETGQYLGAIVQYLDMGNHFEVYKEEKKGPFPKIRMSVAVFDVDEYGDLETTPVLIHDIGMFVKRNERSKSYKAFRALNYTNDARFTHFAQAFMKPYLFKVEKRRSKAGKEYNSIDWAATQPAINPINRRPIPLPEIDDSLKRVFLWNNPTMEQWEKLYVEGEFDDGNSKNFLQEEILNATDFHGSAVDLMLRGGGKSLPTPTPQAEPVEVVVKDKPKPAMPAMPKDDDIPF